MTKIIWSQASRDDLKSIHEFVSIYSKIQASILIKSIISSTIKLRKMSFLGRKVPEFNFDQLREIIHENFRIIYLVYNDDIDIIGVIHSSRDIRKIIFDRL